MSSSSAPEAEVDSSSTSSSSTSSSTSSSSSSSLIIGARHFMREHPFQSVLGLWGTVLTGTGMYLYNRNMPFQLKVIQSRIVAQASLILGAASFAAISLMENDKEKKEYTPAASTWMLKEFESKEQTHGAPMGSHKYSDQHPEDAERLHKKMHPEQKMQ